jgi:hypothetical protein
VNSATQFLAAAYVLGLGLILWQGISLWAQLRNTKDKDGGRP